MPHTCKEGCYPRSTNSRRHDANPHPNPKPPSSRVDTAVDCHSEDFDLLLAIDLPFIVIYQLLPVMYFVLLFVKKDALNPNFRNESAARNKRNKDPSLAPLSFLVIDYTCPCWW